MNHSFDPSSAGNEATAAERAALLRQAFAAWDERAWQSLVDSHPETAEAVEALVTQGLIEPEDLRRYAEDNGYLDGVGSWLARAAAHVRRRQDAAPPLAVPSSDSVE